MTPNKVAGGLIHKRPVVDVLEQRKAFVAWWGNHRPHDPAPDAYSLIFDAWLASARAIIEQESRDAG